MRHWTHLKVRLLDVLWIVVAAAGAAALAGAAVSFLDAVVSPELEGLGWQVFQILVAALWLAASWWVAVGAWARTTWGCPLDADADGACPRHGRQCAAVDRTKEAAV